MRILMLDNEFPPLGGGTAIVNYHLCEEWAKHGGLTVDLVTSSRAGGLWETESFSERITLYKVPVGTRNIHHARNVELIRFAVRGLWQARRLMRQHRYDLCFAFGGVPSGAMALVLRLCHGLPYYLSLEGPDIPGFEDRYRRLYPWLKPLLRAVWRRAGNLRAISRAHRDLALAFLPDLSIPILPNGVDAENFRPPEPPRETGGATLVCVGRLIVRKGQRHLLRALALMPERVRLLLVGTGDDEKTLRDLSAELGLSDRVEFRGFVSRDDMPAVYREADLFVLPSQNEGMSIALLEAMASGLPIAVTDTGGTEELLQGNGALVPWADPKGLAVVLDGLLADPAALARMGERSRELALGYAWPAIANCFLEACRAIARS